MPAPVCQVNPNGPSWAGVEPKTSYQNHTAVLGVWLDFPGVVSIAGMPSSGWLAYEGVLVAPSARQQKGSAPRHRCITRALSNLCTAN
jgi:hypothetical protein